MRLPPGELPKALLVDDALQTKAPLKSTAGTGRGSQRLPGVWPTPQPWSGKVNGRICGGPSHQRRPSGAAVSQPGGRERWPSPRDGKEGRKARGGVGPELHLAGRDAEGKGAHWPLQSEHRSQRWWGTRSRRQSRGVGGPADSAGPRESGGTWQAAPGHVCSPRWSSPP